MNEYLQTEREIKGYVDIQYSDIDNSLPTSASLNYPPDSPISEFTNSNNEKVSQNYASLENDYFLLDGSFVLPYKPENEVNYYNENSGYITNQTVEFLPDEIPISISSISKTISGITLYLKDNIPENIDFIFINSNNETLTYNIENNTKDVITIKFDEEQTITSITMNFSNFEYTDRRFRMSYIDFGLSDILRDSNLINFKIIENIGDLNLEFPTNQLTINLYDEDDIFDINNPSGYADFLNQNLVVKAKPYIGILTENEGIKYNKNLSTFYLKNWSNNKNEITLNCVDYLEKLKDIKNVNRVGEVQLNQSGCNNIDVLLERVTGIEIDTFKNFIDSQNYLNDEYIETINPFEYLQQAMIWLWGYLYNENDKLIVDKRENTEIYDDILFLNDSLLEEPKYTLREKIKSVSIMQYTGYYVDNELPWQGAPTIYFTNSERASQQQEIIELDTYHSLHVSARGFDDDIGIQKIIYPSEFTPVVVSPPTNITYYDLGEARFSTESYKKQFNETGKEITIDNKFVNVTSLSNMYELDTICESICDKINNENKKYDVSIKYTGDPNIKPNMTVPFETQYGEKQVKVLKHILTFNGGLTGTIEGVGD